MIKTYSPVVVTYRCGCSSQDVSAGTNKTCVNHGEPEVMRGSALPANHYKKRKRFNTGSVHLCSDLYFTDKVDIDMSCTIVECPNALVKATLRKECDRLFIIDRNTKLDYIQQALESDYTLYLNCSIGAVVNNIRGMIQTPFLSTFRFISQSDYRHTVTGTKPKPRGQLF